MPDFVHERHKPPRELARPRELWSSAHRCGAISTSRESQGPLVVAVLRRSFAAARPSSIARLPATPPTRSQIESHRTLEPVLKKLRDENYRLVGLEQTSNSHDLHHYGFARRTALVIGNERTGLTDDVLALLDDVVEIPVWGLPYSYNVATATAMSLYEYCRQFPTG